MKIKILFVIILVIAAFALGYLFAPKPAAVMPRDLGSNLLKIMDARMASRNFSDQPLDDKTTNEIMWAAFGKNARGTRTVPTARNKQDLKVYAIRADGAFLYDGEKLNRVSDQDLRPIFAAMAQGFVKTAPLTLLFTGTDATYSPMHAGSSYQNVALYAAERGLGNVVRGMFDKAAAAKALGLADNEIPLISQTIGFVK